ncbi:MAG: YggS family pyridoxal phosphate-dependent enzyme [Propionibacteriaceae bacterium]|nr:YggS family pyridoxal phosphate-dependent enzyme [Propionibacteriaceae bacterium]
MTDPAGRYLAVRASIDESARQVGREPSAVKLLAVSKYQPVAAIAAVANAGCRQFGENRVAEMVSKSEQLSPELAWTLIGHLQRNKAAAALKVMASLQSLDSLDLADRLQRLISAGARSNPLPVLIEVNTSGEVSKNGVDPADVAAFSARLRAFDALQPVGLMTVAHPDPDRAEQGFALMGHLQAGLRQRDGGGWAELSMGMTGDYRLAIAAGSTCVRIGSAIFGPRPGKFNVDSSDHQTAI